MTSASTRFFRAAEADHTHLGRLDALRFFHDWNRGPLLDGIAVRNSAADEKRRGVCWHGLGGRGLDRSRCCRFRNGNCGASAVELPERAGGRFDDQRTIIFHDLVLGEPVEGTESLELDGKRNGEGEDQDDHCGDNQPGNQSALAQGRIFFRT